MLRQTFCHIRGISPSGEQRLWSAGIDSWQALDGKPPAGMSPRRARAFLEEVRSSALRLEAEDAAYFGAQLHANQHWRLFPEFRHRLAYLDIETTGLLPGYDRITTIALYDGKRVRHYVRGRNLGDFKDDIRRFAVIVTYNGKCFDVPFLRQEMGLAMEHQHIDLRYVLASLGYRGGLKGCEQQLGMHRGDLEGVDGYLAVLLWREYEKHGNPLALQTLLAYNIQDVITLEQLLVVAYNLKLGATPFARSNALPRPRPPRVDFQADPDLIRRLQRHSALW